MFGMRDWCNMGASPPTAGTGPEPAHMRAMLTVGAAGVRVAHTRQPTLLGTPADALDDYRLQAGTYMATSASDLHRHSSIIRASIGPALGALCCRCRHGRRGRCCRRCRRTRAPRRCTRRGRWRPPRPPPQARPRRSRRPRWRHWRPPPATSTCPGSPPAHTGDPAFNDPLSIAPAEATGTRTRASPPRPLSCV